MVTKAVTTPRSSARRRTTSPITMTTTTTSMTTCSLSSSRARWCIDVIIWTSLVVFGLLARTWESQLRCHLVIRTSLQSAFSDFLVVWRVNTFTWSNRLLVERVQKQMVVSCIVVGDWWKMYCSLDGRLEIGVSLFTSIQWWTLEADCQTAVVKFASRNFKNVNLASYPDDNLLFWFWVSEQWDYII